MALPTRLETAPGGTTIVAQPISSGYTGVQAAPDSTASAKYGGSLTFGIIVVLLFFGVFGTWATLAPLD
ncbi:MAG: hypothetical protein ACKVH0_15840, partial [Alphaproteobacteria bacterium]